MLAFVAAMMVFEVTNSQPDQSGFFPPALARQTIDCDLRYTSKPVPILDSFAANWYGAMLTAANEPSLFKTQPRTVRGGISTIRFTWLPSFNHPVTVRLYWSRLRRPRLIAKELTGAGGYKPGTIGRSIDRYLNSREAANLASLLKQQRLSTVKPRVCDLGTDGAQWIIEASNSEGYRFIDRQSPERGPIRVVGLALLKLTKWRFNAVY